MFTSVQFFLMRALDFGKNCTLVWFCFPSVHSRVPLHMNYNLIFHGMSTC